jgi:hypothetical protein
MGPLGCLGSRRIQLRRVDAPQVCSSSFHPFRGLHAQTGILGRLPHSVYELLTQDTSTRDGLLRLARGLTLSARITVATLGRDRIRSPACLLAKGRLFPVGCQPASTRDPLRLGCGGYSCLRCRQPLTTLPAVVSASAQQSVRHYLNGPGHQVLLLDAASKESSRPPGPDRRRVRMRRRHWMDSLDPAPRPQGSVGS